MFEITQAMGLLCICLHWEGVGKCGVSVPYKGMMVDMMWCSWLWHYAASWKVVG
jgi:hypothetical protein